MTSAHDRAHVPAHRVPAQHVPPQHAPAQHVPPQYVPPQYLPAQHLPVHVAPRPRTAADDPAPEGEATLGSGADRRAVIDGLVGRAVTGDARARDELLGLIHPLVLRYCRARLGRQESLMGSADDVAQEVCMAVVNALPHYELKGLSFRAFVYGIAAHKVTDAFRAIGRNRAEPVAELPDAPTTVDGPEHRLLAAEISGRLAALLDQLTARQREVLILRMAVGLSAEETAHVVHSTPGAVRVTQHRALGRLRGILLGEAEARAFDDTAADPAHDGRTGHPGLDAMAAFLDGGIPVPAGAPAGARRRR